MAKKCEHSWDWMGDKEMLNYHCCNCPALLINGKIIMQKPINLRR